MILTKTHKKFLKVICLIITIGIVVGCEDFLDYTPKGVVVGDQLDSPAEVEGLCIAAYAALGNDHFNGPYAHLWLHGSVRSDDAYKGGGGVADGAPMHQMEIFNTLTEDQSFNNNVYRAIYDAAARVNHALKKLYLFTEEEYPQVNVRIAEMRFLKAHYHFLLKIIYKYPVYIDYKVPVDSLKYVSNRIYSNDELWNKLAEDLEFAAANLPETQVQIGRANKYAAKAYLAKVRLFQAYEQNEENEVININIQRLNEVVSLCNEVIASAKYSLFDDFGKNFLFGYENRNESIFAIQYSLNDGTSAGRIQLSTGLNYPLAPEYGCCGFHVPSQNLVNAFKTGADGLPLFSTYDNIAVVDSIDFWTNSFDPRLDHTVGINTHPYKYSPTFIYKKSWARTPMVYGYFSTLKEIQLPTSPSFKKFGAFGGSSKNIDILRYDDVLLMKAEALIELGLQGQALLIINDLRQRSQNSTGMLKYSDGSFASNYNIDIYKDGINCSWTQDYAREALRWERRLEFAMEGARFFDLVRWGIAAEKMNSYFENEKTRRAFLATASFAKGRDEYLPIPQQQINLVEGIYQQNNGW